MLCYAMVYCLFGISTSCLGTLSVNISVEITCRISGPLYFSHLKYLGPIKS